MAGERKNTRTSRFLSLVLRHKPEKIGITLDSSGWVDIDVLIRAMTSHGQPITRDHLQDVVDTNNKKRFAISEDSKSTATNVGGRRGKPAVLVIQAAKMAEDGHEFFQSANGVWLTDNVPAEYIDFSSTEWP